jgi:mannan endo-1,4-beta-mannosidase
MLCVLAACISSSELPAQSNNAAASPSAAAAGTTTITGTVPTSSSPVQRPTYNTGNGFFVLNGKLYDANGIEFRIRGVNRLHWGSNSASGIANSGANTERWFIDFTRPASDNIRLIQTQNIKNHELPIVGNWDGTCKTDTATFQSIVATWVSQASQWTTLNKSLIVNVANEWGPADSAVWRDSYIGAIASLRAAGYTGPLLVDSGGCGQDDADLSKYSQAVFNSDPERNVMFALHLYGQTNDFSASIQSIANGNPTVITLNSSSPTHPLVPGYNGTGNSYSGINAYYLSGVQGMTQVNGQQPAPTNVGGSPGA